jgi:biopolymer transport protein ExbD
VPWKPKAAPVMAARNVIPMAGIMLVLLVIFMVMTPMMRTEGLVNMAKAENADDMPNASRDDAIVIAITRDSRLFLSPGNKEISPSTLTDAVKDSVADRLDKTVYVRSDARAKYADVVNTVDEIRAAGVERIGLLTEKIPKQAEALPRSGGG